MIQEIFRDICKLLEGRLLLSPQALTAIADELHVGLGELVQDHLTTEDIDLAECMNSFSDPANKEVILDILDDYIELKESVS